MFWLNAALAFLASPGAAAAAGGDFEVAPWSALPFAALLLLIAVLPVWHGHFWESNRNKALVVAVVSVPALVYVFVRDADSHGAASASLYHELRQYASFIMMLGALYVAAGGIHVDCDIAPRPLANTGFLFVGASLANLVGTTGAGILLVRPFLHINRRREHKRHHVVFFIFTVCNLGGLLTPLGDPPLFLGFLNGIDFFWTLRLWPQWLVANGLVLVVFLFWDWLAYRREQPEVNDPRWHRAIRVDGARNLAFLAGILLAVLMQSGQISSWCEGWLRQFLPLPQGILASPVSEVLMLAMASASWWFTPARIRAANGFAWSPILEVAILFAGIFVTMVPALVLLQTRGRAFGVEQPWQYFWLTGALSSVLDNAPTYVSMATLAAASADFSELQTVGTMGPQLLAAISCGAVFMGANTYIGNGPNFMVKAIAEQADVPVPSFFGYMAYSATILLPIFVLISFIFF